MTDKRAKREPNRANLTDRFMTSVKIPAPPERIDYWDTKLRGFGVRVSYGGSKTFQVMYRVNGRGPVRRLKLGTYPIMSVHDGRETALARLRDAMAGIDPAGDRKQARQAPTFGYLAGEYLEKHAKRHKASWKKDERAIGELNAKFSRRIASEIETYEFANFLEAIRDRGAGIWANRVLEIVRRIYSWGMEPERKIVSVNPLAGVKKLTVEKPKDRWLNATDIKDTYDALSSVPDRMAAFFRLVLATGQRPHEEVRQIHDSEIDLETCWWIIPAEKSKNGKAHSVPLNAEAMDAIKVAQAHRGDSKWLFPMTGNPNEPMSDTAYRKPLAKLIEASGVAKWTPHDLRASAITHWEGEMSIPRETVSKLANHADPSITAGYVRNSYDAKKRVAMDAWGERLKEIKSGKGATGKVVKLTDRQSATA